MGIEILQDFRPCRLANTNVSFPDSALLDSKDEAIPLSETLGKYEYLPDDMASHTSVFESS